MAIRVALGMSEVAFGHAGGKGHHRAEAQWPGGGAAAHGITARRAFEAVERLVEAAVGAANITWHGHAIPAIEVVHVAETLLNAALDGFHPPQDDEAGLPASADEMRSRIAAVDAAATPPDQYERPDGQALTPEQAAEQARLQERFEAERAREAASRAHGEADAAAAFAETVEQIAVETLEAEATALHAEPPPGDAHPLS